MTEEIIDGIQKDAITVAVEEVPAVESNDLQSRLTAITEKKSPGVVKEKTEKSYWDASDDDFEKPVKESSVKSNEETSESSKKTELTESTDTPAKALTKEAKIAAAGSAVGAIDLLNKIVCNPLLNYKCKNKIKKSFTEKDLVLIDEKIAAADESDLDEKEKRIKVRLDNILEKIEKKRAGIPFNKEEKDEMTEAFKAYSDVTGKDMPPGLWLGISIATVMGKRAVDILMD